MTPLSSFKMPLVSPRNHLFSFLIPSMCLYLCLSNSLFLSLYDSLDSNNFNEECEYFQWIVVQEQYETLKKILNFLLRYINYLQTVLFLYIMTLFFIRKWVENAHLQGQGQLFLSPRSIYIYFTLEHDTSWKPYFRICILQQSPHDSNELLDTLSMFLCWKHCPMVCYLFQSLPQMLLLLIDFFHRFFFSPLFSIVSLSSFNLQVSSKGKGLLFLSSHVKGLCQRA